MYWFFLLDNSKSSGTSETSVEKSESIYRGTLLISQFEVILLLIYSREGSNHYKRKTRLDYQTLGQEIDFTFVSPCFKNYFKKVARFALKYAAIFFFH